MHIVIASILKREEASYHLKHGMLKQFDQGHTSRKHQIKEMNPGAQEFALSISCSFISGTYYC